MNTKIYKNIKKYTKYKKNQNIKKLIVIYTYK
jgi:hypothetical protein